MVVRSIAANNGTGLRASSLATIRVSLSTVTGNSIGLDPSQANLLSYGDNNVDGNGTDGAFTGSLSKK
jgi:hypothetical protein